MPKTLDISPEEIEKQAKQIFTPVKNGESGVGVCYPACKIGYNLHNFIRDKKLLQEYLGKDYKNVTCIIVDLEAQETPETILQKISPNHSSISFTEFCKNLLEKGKDIYFFLLNGQLVPKDRLEIILQLLHREMLQTTRVNSQIFFEGNIYTDPIAGVLAKYNKFLQNINIFPVYSHEESKKFIVQLAKSWNLTLSAEFVSQIVDTYGGNLWLLRESIRLIREHGYSTTADITQSPGIQLRIKTIYNQFSLAEKQALANLCFADRTKVASIYENYFLQIRVITKDSNGYHLTLPLLEDLLKKDFLSQDLALNGNNSIVYKGKVISPLLTLFEDKLLQFLLHHRGEMVSREMLAQHLWRSDWEEKYSDWALDKLMSRLRKRLEKIGIPKNIIITKKGKGFILT